MNTDHSSLHAAVWVACVRLVTNAAAAPARAGSDHALISFSAIGAKATADYHGDAVDAVTEETPRTPTNRFYRAVSP